MQTKKINHIGVAVPSIEDYLGFFRDMLGLEPKGEEVVPSQKVKVAFLAIGDSTIELLEPTSDDSPIKKYLDKNGGKPKFHHIAFEVADLEAALEEARQKGAQLIDETPRIGARGIRIAFIHPKSSAGVLTELCEHH